LSLKAALSPGFYVDETGRVFVNELIISPENGVSVLRADDLYIRGVQILEGAGDGSSLLALGNNIIGSSLTRLGTQEYLNVNGNISFSQGANSYISIVNGLVAIDSVSATGRINNITVGLTTPAASRFTTTTITGSATVQGASVLTTVTATNISASGNIEIETAPTVANHATRKDYVDNRISAFAIAFGA